MARTFSFLRRLRRDERGLSVVELGLVAPVLALFIGGMIDLSQGLAQRFAMQQAVNGALQLLLAHPVSIDPNAAPDEDPYDYVIAHVTQAAGVAESAVEIDEWLQCDEERMAEDVRTCDAGEDTARYVAISVEKPFDGQFFVDDMVMSATSVMRVQ